LAETTGSLVPKYAALPEAHQMPTQAQANEFHEDLVAVAKELGGDISVITNLPDPGELYLVRLCNLPGASSFMTYNAPWWYLDENDLLPVKEWQIQWAAGIYALSSSYLRMFDFTHPKVKGVFSAQYELEDVFYRPGEARAYFDSFQRTLVAAKARVDANADDCCWMKIVQWDGDCRIRACY
jgi:hypothetical protein